jgi:hypothetical protein
MPARFGGYFLPDLLTAVSFTTRHFLSHFHATPKRASRPPRTAKGKDGAGLKGAERDGRELAPLLEFPYQENPECR